MQPRPGVCSALVLLLWLAPGGYAQEPAPAEPEAPPADAAQEAAVSDDPVQPDSEREQSLRDSVLERLQRVDSGAPETGEMISIGEGGFAAIQTPSDRPEVQGAVVLVPDLDRHPDWPGVIRQLRRELPRYGWTTLSLQPQVLPLGTPRADFGTVVSTNIERIKQAFAYLASESGITNVVMVGHGLGALAALQAADEMGDGQCRALVLVSLENGEDLEPPVPVNELSGAMTIPTLGVVGRSDLPRVRTVALSFAGQAGRDGMLYEHLVLAGGHQLRGSERELASRVRGFLDRASPGEIQDR